ncbi:P-loop containing nucleoside triphosphate hydrolase protein [Dioscorea alata]|uniref:P-loop containing nucleoside triphosphate hydrolase protein n=2 Tax=Dioscorea alata TaxID=55571 RepID=A0ACB7V7Y8_DIOAL|nr:P-loop containing nucleoside triphosphate hydrolase protein [Dioscorea alata]KAH7669534.1 P-loop containing nucleoside triphosphate hydrolase protein [Dioscorea alata]
MLLLPLLRLLQRPMVSLKNVCPVSKADLPGWPLLSPSKVQMQKCDKCSREFCSTINYRRHIRVHRRSLNIDKDSSKNRELLGEFWSKLSPDEAKEIFSLKDVAIEEVTGPSILRSLGSLIRMPAFSSLPHVYVKAGATLLDIIQARPSRFPISSQDLFSVLDDASEKTFMCAGTATTMQKFVFDGEAGKVALEMKNLVACTSFLLEQKLVKAWLADKDAEALRCQKLLVEEEEAARKRQAEILERKRLKKLRQKVQKAKETVDADKLNYEASSADAVDSASGSAETPSPSGSSEPDMDSIEATAQPLPESVLGLSTSDMELNKSLKHGDVADQAVNKKQLGSGRWQPIPLCHQATKLTKNIPKTSVPMKHGANYRDLKTGPPTNAHMIWARKAKHETEEEGSCDKEGEEKKHQCHQYQSAVSDNHEVLIGSISVALKNGNCHCQGDTALKQSDSGEKVGKSNLNTVNPSMVKLCRPVSHDGNEDSIGLESEKRETEMDDAATGMESTVSSNEICQATDEITVQDLPGPRPFSSDVVKAFLAQRWKEAIASDHVMLVLDLENETSGCIDFTVGNCTPPIFERSVLGSAENRMAAGSVTPPSSVASKTKFRAKQEKNYKVKYVPKQKNVIPEG